MPIVRFEKDTEYLQFSKNIKLPVSRPLEKIQAIDRTASGGIHTEELGPAIRRRVLAFKAIPKDDYDKLEHWFNNVANGAMNSFTYIDERGASMTVRIISNKLDFQEFFEGWFRGQLTLEVE